MTNSIIKLTPEQEALIPIIRDEWIKIGLDTTPTDKQKAEEAIALAYECAELKPPQQFLWFKNPVEAAIYVNYQQLIMQRPINDTVQMAVEYAARDAVNQAVDKAIWDAVGDAVWNVENTVDAIAWDLLWDAVWDTGNAVGVNIGSTIRDAIWGSFEVGELAFCAYFDAIGVDCSKLKGLWETAKHCGWWWAFEKIAIVTPKPSIIRLDDRGRLHGLGEPAIAYEGFNVYAYHGVRLPDKYGAIHPDSWQSEWLLKEDNAELRRVLIQGIGYARICSELQAIELDNWQEYALLKIDANLDEEPIYLLKMTCPSTGFIHVLRVPPDVRTAKEAIAWINWGIAPEEFAIQT